MSVNGRAWIAITFLLAAHVAYAAAGAGAMAWQTIGCFGWLLAYAWMVRKSQAVETRAATWREKLIEARADVPAEVEPAAPSLDRLFWEERGERGRRDRDKLLEHCRPATADEYDAWLRGYRERGGRVSHYRDWPMRRYYVLMSDPGWIPELFGANSVEMIVPRGVMSMDALRTGVGHSRFFFVADFQLVGGYVESFTDARGGR